MNQEQLEEMMVGQNPQWQTSNYWEESLNLKRDAFFPLWESLVNNRLVLAINGPRRVGKSYLFRQLIAQLIRTKTTLPQNIFYFSFGTSLDEKEIIKQLITTFRERFSSRKSGPIVIFLDEVQFISFWQDQVKFFYDQDLQIKFVVTGSTSLFRGQKSRESLLGRLEKLTLGVMSFGEYLRFKKLPEGAKNRAELISRLPVWRGEWQDYLAYGQLPELVLNSGINPKDYFLQMADTLINYDVPWLYQKLDRTLFSNLFKTLSLELANEVSVNKLALGLGANRHEINQYLQILDETGYFAICYNSFFKKMRAKVSGVKKIYSLNTNLSLATNAFDKSYFNDSRVLGHFAENYVFMRLEQKFGSGLEYYSDRKREVDFVTKDTIWEVKYGRVGDLTKYQEVAAKLGKRLVVVTEAEMETGAKINKIPIYLL